MNLIDFLKINEETRKVFGKRELKIIEKQLLGVNLTQSEKNRLSRDIRKKFDFIKKAAKFKEEFKLKKGSAIQKRINYAQKIILEDKLFKKIKKIIVYGSAAEKKLTFRSDIDIAVVFDKISPKESTKFRIRISGQLSSKIDIQVYNQLPLKIQKQIDSKGKIIYENRR